MDQLNAMRIFHCIVDARGFSAAAERLGTTHSTVSRQLKQLEHELGVQLLKRNTRNFTLTAAGELYYAACLDVLKRVEAAGRAIAGEQEKVAGSLRVSAPLAIGALELADWLPGLQKRYPDLQLDLSCSDRYVDIVAEGFDVALRISPTLADTSLMARVLTVSDIVLVAAPAYLARRGLPRTVAQLAQHDLIGFSPARAPAKWTLTPERGEPSQIELRGDLRVDTIAALYAAVLAGAGIAGLTRHTVKSALAAGQLVHLLPAHTLGQRHYYALYPQTQYVSPKLRAFVDHMAEHYRTD
ncbi:LysR family transcriptional regulator [Pseudomonas sp. CGJS7]|uniref:LysR family transcriptional regulator n=1 Tax=Pseudomonas sp. CGJS7 TaxID=3109348 RepID=UPI003009FBF7